MRQVADRPAPSRGPSAPVQRAPPPVLVECLAPEKGVNILLATPLGNSCLDLLKIGPYMVGSKDHTKISTTNIIKPAMEALPADDQRPFEDLVMRDEKEVMRQWNEQRDKEEAELLHKLSERRK
jgi:hypothetical protein